MTTDPAKVLVIEDDAGVALALYGALNAAYKVDVAKTAASGLRKVGTIDFDVIVLDLGLPDMSGLEVCRRLRALGVVSPILILTGQAATASKVALLDAGASDYVTKPFSLEELKARLRVLLRRSQLGGPDRLVVGDLVVDTQLCRVERDGQLIVLRRKEYAILECLMRHAGSVVTRDTLVDYAWDGHGYAWTNTVDVHINHLRARVDRPFGRQLIKTVHGLGYKLELAKDHRSIAGRYRK